jgi:hypothetical protein
VLVLTRPTGAAPRHAARSVVSVSRESLAVVSLSLSLSLLLSYFDEVDALTG